MRSAFNPALRAALICILQLGLSFVAESSRAQSRMPTAGEIASIRGCAARNKDDLDKGERQCLFKLVAERCIGIATRRASSITTRSKVRWRT
jgi:hypothetical protein